MVKLLSTISLVLAIILFPPAVLAVVSNNAVPGDLTYPIKRGLENVIYAAASVNPTTKAWFAGARSDRRYEEVSALLAQGKTVDQSLNELVEQTQVVATQINQVSDPVQKQKLIAKLSDSITKYDAGLAQASQKQSQSSGVTPEQVQAVTPAPVITTPPSAQPVIPSQPQAAVKPQPSTFPQAPTVPSTTAPQSTTAPNPATPLPTFVPTPPPPSSNSNIDRARDDLERIKNNLERQKSNEGINEDRASQKDQGKSKQPENKDNDFSKKGKAK